MDGDAERHRGSDGARVEHLGAEGRQLARLVEADVTDELRIGDDPRVRRQHPVDVRPDLDRVDMKRGAEQRRGVVGASAPERGGHAVRVRTHEASHHRHSARMDHRCDESARILADRLRLRYGLPEPIVGAHDVPRVHVLGRDPHATEGGSNDQG